MSIRHKRAAEQGGKGPARGQAGPGQQGVTGNRPAPKPAVKRAPVAWTHAQWAAALAGITQQMGLGLSDTQCDKLAAYMIMLAHWNSTFNLTALRDPEDMLSHHLADCLSVLPALEGHLARLKRAAPARLLDVGSGGGLPGVVLAICEPEVLVTCVDTVGKKAAFIRQVAAELGLPNLRGEHARVEQLTGTFDVITSRAFASLADFVALTSSLLATDGVWMAMKGKHPEAELAALPQTIAVFHVEQLTVPSLEAERCLVWMRPVSA